MIELIASSFANEFHRLERSLVHKSGSSGSMAVQFTACHENSGVTSLTLAFASFLARLHGPESVIAVEANLRQPQFAKTYQLDGSRGLLDTLERTVTPEEVTIDTKEGFAILPAGSIRTQTACGALESCFERMGEVIGELRKRYTYIILDTPPVGRYIDATIIGGYVDGSVIVVEANVTRSEVLEDAINRLRAGESVIYGVILNKREFHIPKWLYKLL
jgi:Mrp family chromosome partitioning ATPase